MDTTPLPLLAIVAAIVVLVLVAQTLYLGRKRG